MYDSFKTSNVSAGVRPLAFCWPISHSESVEADDIVEYLNKKSIFYSYNIRICEMIWMKDIDSLLSEVQKTHFNKVYDHWSETNSNKFKFIGRDREMENIKKSKFPRTGCTLIEIENVMWALESIDQLFNLYLTVFMPLVSV